MNSRYASSARGVVTSPHYLATEAGKEALKGGGNAIEAALAVGSVLTVVYPHMNSMGGDAFFLISDEKGNLIALDGAGPAGERYSAETYLSQGLTAIPERGPMVANTVAGVVSLWNEAYKLSRSAWGGEFAWGRLLEPALSQALNGITLSSGQLQSLRDNWSPLSQSKTFLDTFLLNQEIPKAGTLFKQPALAETLKVLIKDGGDSFYRGNLAKRIVNGLQAEGCLLQLEDFARYSCRRVDPVTVPYGNGMLANMPPPTFGLASLIILGLIDRFDISRMDHQSADYIHLLAEATKLAFRIRDQYISDPDYVEIPLKDFLKPKFLNDLALKIDPKRAQPWGKGGGPGDTVWFGVMDEKGRAVSAIQSIYHEYGSGIMAGDTGIVWQNRGYRFSLQKGHVNFIQPGKRPAHTLNSPMYLEKGRPKLVYGTMGGEGIPQIQAMVATRALNFALPLEGVLDSPRWVLGRAWGDHSPTTLKLEERFGQSVFGKLKEMGHDVEWLPDYSKFTGHAGVIRVLENGVMEAASDPRSDGTAAAV